LAISAESLIPLRFITGLFGAQTTPPDRAVDPPNLSVFSTISGRLPASSTASAAGTEAAPLPTMRKSQHSSQASWISGPDSLPFTALSSCKGGSDF